MNPVRTASTFVIPRRRQRRQGREEGKSLGTRVASSAPEKPEPLVLHGVNVTHPDRVISKAEHVTKGGLARYYAAIAPFLLHQISRHPLSLLRCPAGVDRQCFYQRNPGKGLGSDVYAFKFSRSGRRHEYLYIQDEKGLLQLVQMGAIEIHPWGSSIDAIDYPALDL